MSGTLIIITVAIASLVVGWVISGHIFLRFFKVYNEGVRKSDQEVIDIFFYHIENAEMSPHLKKKLVCDILKSFEDRCKSIERKYKC